MKTLLKQNTMKTILEQKNNFFLAKIILGFILFFVTLTTTAQQGINYKALISDNAGNAIANDVIEVQFSILRGTAQTNLYTETHAPTTDANGLIILNIGEGTLLSGDFTSIDWSIDVHFLNTQIDTGAGLVDMGTTAFKAVPYALHAATAETANNVSGLEKITENGRTGWRILGQNPANYGNLGSNSVDLSYSSNASTTTGALGPESVAMGRNTTASGNRAFAMGTGTNASGDYSTALGYTTSASGRYTTALGENTTAESYAQTTLGTNNTTNTGTISTFVATDRLFVIGNGVDDSNKSDALIILKNGIITAPSLDIAEITDNKALVTKEYFDTNATAPATGLEKITEGVDPGWRLVDKNPANYGNVGRGAVDFSFSNNTSSTKGATAPHATAMGSSTTASGFNSMATGNDTTASGNSSFSTGTSTEASGDSSAALGYATTASGIVSIAMGTYTTASGDYSTALGYATSASGRYTTALGENTTAESYAQTTLGTNNTTNTGTISTFVATDRLFVIGNGVDDSNKSDALIILKNGIITAPSLDIAEITDNKALVTKEYVDNTSGTYAIGDFAQGGIVFWLDETGRHGLVCAKMDQNGGSGIRWYAGTHGLTRARGDGMLSGEANTAIIIAAQVAIGDDGNDYAAQICNELQTYEGGNNYGDWYLPSKKELSQISFNHTTINTTAIANGGVAFATTGYWSSTEGNNSNTGWLRNVYNNIGYTAQKHNTAKVRAIRAF